MSELPPPQAKKVERFPVPAMALEDVETPEDFLQAIDFNVLNDIFDVLVLRSRGESEPSNTGYKITPESVSITLASKDEEIGVAQVRTGQIYLTWSPEKHRRNPLQHTLSVLAALLHEATHIRGGYKEEGWDIDTEEVSRMGVKVRTGLKQDEIELQTTAGNSTPTKSVSSIGLSLNEAVTENISIDGLREYLVRTGNSTHAHQTSFTDAKLFGTRTLDRLALAGVLHALAEKLSISRDDLWKGFVQAYMNGNEEVKTLLSLITEELKDDPKLMQLLELLAADKDIEATGGFEMDTILSHIDDSRLRLLASRELQKFDAEELRNALGLR